MVALPTPQIMKAAHNFTVSWESPFVAEWGIEVGHPIVIGRLVIGRLKEQGARRCGVAKPTGF